METIDELLHKDKTLHKTWESYLEFLEDPHLPPEQAATFLDRLEQDPDAIIGWTSRYPYVRTQWLLRLGRFEDAAAAWRLARRRGAGSKEENETIRELLTSLKTSPVIREADAQYERELSLPGDGAQGWKTRPLLALEQRELVLPYEVRRDKMMLRQFDFFKPTLESCERVPNALGTTTLRKGEEVCIFRCYGSPDDELFARADEFNADPLLAENRRKYEQDAYELRDYRTRRATFSAPCINEFLATATPEDLDIPALLRTVTSMRGGDFLFETENWELCENARANGEMLHLLYILKKCGYMDAIFRALPELPEDFPLLLMCFADSAVRRRVEDYMGIPGLAAMYDLAFAPRRLEVEEQIRLVEFGRARPHFQKLLGVSLSRYGYHLFYNPENLPPLPDWRIQDFSHFRDGFCADVLLFLLSAPETLDYLQSMLEDRAPSPWQRGHNEAYCNIGPYFQRNVVGYLALNRDDRLQLWKKRCLAGWPNTMAYHERLGTAALADELQELPREPLPSGQPAFFPKEDDGEPTEEIEEADDDDYLDFLLCQDKALESTWNEYLEFLKDPALTPEQAEAFLDRLEQDPEARLGYGTEYLYQRTKWLLRLNRPEDAAAAWTQVQLYGATNPISCYEIKAFMEQFPILEEAKRRYYRQNNMHGDAPRPFIWLERGPLRLKSMWDDLGREYRYKGDDVYLYRRYAGRSELAAVGAEPFDADPGYVEFKEKYEHDAYTLQDYRFPPGHFHMPCINEFMATATPENLNIPALLRTAGTMRGGSFPCRITKYWGKREIVLYETDTEVEFSNNREFFYLLYILKKCGYMDAIFSALPELPEDFPLLLMSFADTTIRKRVEDYMGMPGLADMYNLAFAPRRLGVKDQLKLVEFGRNNPRFQELLGTSLFRYGYHLYNQYRPGPDWYVQDFAHFRCAFCGDVLLFLLSAPETLPQLQILLEGGAATKFSGGDEIRYGGFRNCASYFTRNIMGYLALNDDPRLLEWQYHELRSARADEHRRLKTEALITALQKLPRKTSVCVDRELERKADEPCGDNTAQSWKTRPLIRLERRSGKCRALKDQLGDMYLYGSEEVCLFRFYGLSESADMGTIAVLFDADPELVENSRKYEEDAYALRDYRTPFVRFQMPCIREFFAADAPENPDIPALLRAAATARGGGFPWGVARTVEKRRQALLYESGGGDCTNLEVLPLLYILKKCGYLDAIFRALPELPEDFPLLLMCFADKALRKRVEDYMGIPGLAAMYDLAFAPRYLNVREQVRLAEFGRDNPRFQKLLGTSLYRYGYHLAGTDCDLVNTNIQEFDHFRDGFCADVLLFLVSAPDALPQLRQLLDSGPEAYLSCPVFSDSMPWFSRNLLGYLALNNDPRLPDWLCRTQDAPFSTRATTHKTLKTQNLVKALHKRAQS